MSERPSFVRVQLLEAPADPRAALLLVRAARVSLGDAKALLKTPRVLPLEFEAVEGEQLLAGLLGLGARAVLIRVPSRDSSRCLTHPLLLPDGPCVHCRQGACGLCLEAGSGKCAACHRRSLRKGRWRNARIALLLLAFLAVGGAPLLRRLEAHRRTRGVPLRIAIVLVQAERGSVAAQGWKTSVEELHGWVNGEAARHGRRAPALERVTLHGPLVSPEAFALEVEEGWEWFDRWKFSRAVRSTLEPLSVRAGVPKDTHFALYVLLAPGEGERSLRVEGFTEEGAAWGLVRASASGAARAMAQMAMAHELLHSLGATDKYDEAGRTRSPAFLADPAQRPLYPQKKAEVMVGEVALSPVDGRLPDTLQDVAVGPETAREIGWVGAVDGQNSLANGETRCFDDSATQLPFICSRRIVLGG